MTGTALLKLIRARWLRALAVTAQVGYQVRKLPGEVMFKLILFLMLNSWKFSLLVMERFLAPSSFKSFARSVPVHGKYNSIRDRSCTIRATSLPCFVLVYTLVVP